MFENIRLFFARLFGWESSQETVGFEDASDLPDNITITEIAPPEEEMASRSVGTRSAGTRSVGFEDLEGTPTNLDAVTISSPKFLWCLDNGHGRLQAGKRSPVWSDGTQLEEWKFNREIVQRMIKRLDKIGVQYYNIVPEDDVDSFLAERVGRANDKVSSLGLKKIYVSIHANASEAASASGVETWYHLNSSTGIRLASVFQRHIMNGLGKQTYQWKDRGIRSYKPAGKNFYVLRKTSMPAVLTENGFYSNETECKQLLESETMDIIADAHVSAILEIEMNGYANASIYSPNLHLSV